jgi:hypothetical protein
MPPCRRPFGCAGKVERLCSRIDECGLDWGASCKLSGRGASPPRKPPYKITVDYTIEFADVPHVSKRTLLLFGDNYCIILQCHKNDYTRGTATIFRPKKLTFFL